MTLPVYPNALSASAIKTEFGISGQLQMSTLYRKDSGPVYTGVFGYPFGGAATAPPTSGDISFSKFTGSTKYTPVSQTVTIYSGSGTWTVPSTLIGNLTIKAFGGGGGGAMWPSNAPGGGGGGGAKFIGSIARGTAINYTVATGGPGFRGDSSRYARDPGNTQFGVSGDAYYMYIPGLGVGAYNMVGSQVGRGYGSTAQGAAGITLGTGGDGGYSSDGTAAITIGGGGGGGWYSYNGGAGADGGGRGGNTNEDGVWPGGGGHGQDGTGYAGATGGIIITGTW